MTKFLVFAAAMALAGEIRIDIVAAGNARRRPRWRQPPQFASQEQLATELVA